MVPPVATDPEIEKLIAAHAPVAIGVSGGKDSQAAAIATYAYLDSKGHAGPRLLIHSDLGMVEWKESGPVCRRLADHLKTELVVVRRIAGGMMERWESRWLANSERYRTLQLVRALLPWSTPGMRFCTSELKTDVIESELKRRFGRGTVYVNVTGVRRQESAARAKGSVAGRDANGNWNWRPISDWTTEEVFAAIAGAGLEPHQAYTKYGLSRVSCRYCIMSNAKDLEAAAKATESHELYRRMVDLEIASTFAFQGTRWLADVFPRILTDEQRLVGVPGAKIRAAQRVALESKLTPAMLFQKGWPVRMLTDDEADILAEVRIGVSGLIGVENPLYVDRESIHARYAELIGIREDKAAEKAAKADRAAARRKPAEGVEEEPAPAMAIP